MQVPSQQTHTLFKTSIDLHDIRKGHRGAEGHSKIVVIN